MFFTMLDYVKQRCPGIPVPIRMVYLHVIIKVRHCFRHQWHCAGFPSFSVQLYRRSVTILYVTDFYVKHLLYACACVIQKDHKKLIPHSLPCCGVGLFHYRFYGILAHIFQR